jgi:hypothetical protein
MNKDGGVDKGGNYAILPNTYLVLNKFTMFSDF